MPIEPLFNNLLFENFQTHGQVGVPIKKITPYLGHFLVQILASVTPDDGEWVPSPPKYKLFAGTQEIDNGDLQPAQFPGTWEATPIVTPKPDSLVIEVTFVDATDYSSYTVEHFELL